MSMMWIGREIWKYHLGIYINEQNETKNTANPDSQFQDPDSKPGFHMYEELMSLDDSLYYVFHCFLTS
jgi:hypothetical protein